MITTDILFWKKRFFKVKASPGKQMTLSHLEWHLLLQIDYQNTIEHLIVFVPKTMNMNNIVTPKTITYIRKE